MLTGRHRFWVLALITIVLAFSTGDRATLSVAGPHMSKALNLGPVEMGWLFAAFAWAYVLFQIPAGWVVDQIGAKRGMLVGLTVWSAITMAMGVVPWIAFPFVTLLILRFLLGLFEAPVGPASARTIAAWFPSSERGVAGAIFNSAQYISLAIFNPLMGWLSHQFGWEHIFYVMGGLGLLLGLLWATTFFMPSKHPSVSAGEIDFIKKGGALIETDAAIGSKAVTDQASAPGPSFGDIGQLFKSRMLVGIFIAQYCITAITWFFVSWFPTYLVQGRGFSILQAGFVAALPAIAGFIGGVSTGFFSDWILKRTGDLSLARKIPITIGLGLSALMIACNYVDTDWVVIGLMCAAFFGKGFGSLGWTVVADTAPKEIIGLTGGVFNALGNIAGIFTPLVIGYILSSTGSFNGALLYVGLHGIVAIVCYWVLVGKIQRLDIRRDEPVPAGAPQPSRP
jgi:ACS family glucarate transporter-like MFS transporter